MKDLRIVLLVVGAIFLLAGAAAYGAAVAVPDLKIGKKAGKQKGDGVNSANGAGQTIRVKTNPRGKGKFFFTAENDDGAFAGDMKVTATRKNRKFKARYIQTSPAADRGNVTAAITGPGLDLAAVPPGGSAGFKAIVKAGRQFRDRGVRKTFLVTVTDESGGGNPLDVGKSKVKKKR